MKANVLQKFIKKEFVDIASTNFITIKEWHIKDDITNSPLNLKNTFLNWTDVDYHYLTKYCDGIAGLNNAGFLFYTPAIIYHVLDNTDDRMGSSVLMYWLFKLKDENLNNNLASMLSLFNENQLLLILVFLEIFCKKDEFFCDDICDMMAKIEQLILNHPKDTL